MILTTLFNFSYFQHHEPWDPEHPYWNGAKHLYFLKAENDEELLARANYLLYKKNKDPLVSTEVGSDENGNESVREVLGKSINEIEGRTEFRKPKCLSKETSFSAWKKTTVNAYYLEQELESSGCLWSLRYKSRNETLKEGKGTLVVSRLDIPAAMMIAHLTEDTSQHERITNTEIAGRLFYWKGKKKDIEFWIKTCPCTNRTIPRYSPPLKSMVPKAPRDRIHVDMFGPLPVCTSTSAAYGCIQIDAFTKKIVVHLFPTKEAKPIAVAVRTSWEPPPKEVQTDWGREFVNQYLEEVVEGWNAIFVHGRPYHPQSNGKAERAVQTMKNYILQLVAEHSNWGDYVQGIVHEYNHRRHRATRFKPVELEAEVTMTHPRPKAFSAQHFRQPKQLALEKRIKKAYENMMAMAKKSEEYRNKIDSATFVTFRVGELVAVKHAKGKIGKKKKLSDYKYKAVIYENLGFDAYRLKWTTKGPLERDKEGTVSEATYSCRVLKKIICRSNTQLYLTPADSEGGEGFLTQLFTRRENEPPPPRPPPQYVLRQQQSQEMLSEEDIRRCVVERWQKVLSISLDEVTSQEDDLSNDEKQVIAIMRKFVNLLCAMSVSEAISTAFRELSSEPTESSGSDLLSICLDDDSEGSSDEPPSTSLEPLSSIPISIDSTTSVSTSSVTQSNCSSSIDSTTSVSTSSETLTDEPVDTTKIVKFRLLDQIFKGVCTLKPRPAKSFSGSYNTSKVFGEPISKKPKRNSKKK